MSNFQLNTPIAFIIFNRPDTTARVFAEIAKAKPSKLLIIADGPRKNRDGEAEKCTQARSVIQQINWPCELSTNFSDINLGCKERVASGITWVFEQVEEAIILEDDCLPDQSFFRFCEELLVKYRHDSRIGMISGSNFNFGKKYTESSYYFSRYNHIWGWATWRRAWNNYDVDMKIWPEFYRNNYLDGIVHSAAERRFWVECFDSVARGEIDTWDYQWVFSSFCTNSLAIVPEINLISNIGFGQDATHTINGSPLAAIDTESMQYPLIHPRIYQPNFSSDINVSSVQFSKKSFVERLLTKLRINLQVGK